MAEIGVCIAALAIISSVTKNINMALKEHSLCSEGVQRLEISFRVLQLSLEREHSCRERETALTAARDKSIASCLQTLQSLERILKGHASHASNFKSVCDQRSRIEHESLVLILETIKRCQTMIEPFIFPQGLDKTSYPPYPDMGDRSTYNGERILPSTKTSPLSLGGFGEVHSILETPEFGSLQPPYKAFMAGTHADSFKRYRRVNHLLTGWDEYGKEKEATTVPGTEAHIVSSIAAFSPFLKGSDAYYAGQQDGCKRSHYTAATLPLEGDEIQASELDSSNILELEAPGEHRVPSNGLLEGRDDEEVGPKELRSTNTPEDTTPASLNQGRVTSERPGGLIPRMNKWISSRDDHGGRLGERTSGIHWPAFTDTGKWSLTDGNRSLLSILAMLSGGIAALTIHNGSRAAQGECLQMGETVWTCCRCHRLLSKPTGLEAIVACYVYIGAMITYQQLHKDEKYQPHSLLAATIFAALIGVARGFDMMLEVLPWSILWGLLLCTICKHTNVNFLRRASGNAIEDCKLPLLEKEKFGI